MSAWDIGKIAATVAVLVALTVLVALIRKFDVTVDRTSREAEHELVAETEEYLRSRTGGA